MKNLSEAFTFSPPHGWEESRRGAAWVFRRPECELVVSVWPLKENTPLNKQKAAIEALQQTALKAIKKDLKNTNLRVSVPLSRVDENQMEFWIQSLCTRDHTTLLCSAVVRGTLGVLLATLEAPNQPVSFPTFVEFLRSVQRPPV